MIIREFWFVKNAMKVGFLLFERWHGKEQVGSSRIRGHWVIKNWQGAENYVQGQKYDAIIFQKTYWPEYWKHYKGVKILDLCDPDWLSGHLIGDPVIKKQGLVEMLPYIDAITTSSPALTEPLKEIVRSNNFDIPIKCIPDRVDLTKYRVVKQHKGEAKQAVWFGYAHNTEALDVAMPFIKQHNLRLIVISDQRPLYKKADQNKKFDQAKLVSELVKHDIAVFPNYKQGRFYFKSNNKTIQCWAVGLPVATTPDELSRFMDGEARQKEATKRRKEVEERYDVKLSVKEYKDLICEIQKKKLGLL